MVLSWLLTFQVANFGKGTTITSHTSHRIALRAFPKPAREKCLGGNQVEALFSGLFWPKRGNSARPRRMRGQVLTLELAPSRFGRRFGLTRIRGYWQGG
jgi:hypothetical protein